MKVIRKLTEKDNLFLKEFVREVINKECKDKNNLAAYINCYRIKEIDYIYINIIREDLNNNQLVLWQSFDNSIIIKVLAQKLWNVHKVIKYITRTTLNIYNY